MIPLAKNIKRYFSFKEMMVVLIAVIISVSAGVGVFLNLKKEVSINVDGKATLLKTMKNTVREVLEQSGTELGSDDYINLPLDAKLQKMKRNEIYIKRAVPVYVTVDGGQKKIMAYEGTLGEVLAKNSIGLSDKDKLMGAELDTEISKDLSVRIVRVREEMVTENVAVPYKVVTKNNDRIDKGKQLVVQNGKEGVREKLFKVIMEDGKQVVKELVKDSIAVAPVNKIIENGTVLNFKTSRGEVVRYKKQITMKATAYTASYSDTGKNPGDAGFGITYTGRKVKKGIVAVDPKVIPLGTRLYIEGVGQTADYGFAVAADIGGAVKGNIIDLYFESSEDVRKWGRKTVKVYVLTS